MGKLVRGLNLSQAVAVNVIDMVGIGPFVTMPFIIGAMQGPTCLLAWLAGAVLAFADGSVWAELGAKWPEAGGSYVFLQHLYGEKKWGRLMAFLFTWQTIIQAPLVIASGAIGFSQYFSFLIPVNVIEQKLISGLVVAVVTLLLYRNIKVTGKISMLFGIAVIGTIGWIIFGGLQHFPGNFSWHKGDYSPFHFSAFTPATSKAIYCYLGYYNVCHLGGEIKSPERNIPRSIFISIGIIACLYLLMQTSVLTVVPWQQAKDSPFLVSLFFEKLYGQTTAAVASALILLIAFSSLFAVMLGYSRIPYAAAIDGNFFKVFGKLHPEKNFPYVSLLTLGAVAFIFSLLFKLQQVITAIVVMRILVQFVAQSIGIIAWHRTGKAESFPFKMWLYPLPPLLAIGIWLTIFFSSAMPYVLSALAIIATGIIIYHIKEKLRRKAL